MAKVLGYACLLVVLIIPTSVAQERRLLQVSAGIAQVMLVPGLAETVVTSGLRLAVAVCYVNMCFGQLLKNQAGLQHLITMPFHHNVIMGIVRVAVADRTQGCSTAAALNKLASLPATTDAVHCAGA